MSKNGSDSLREDRVYDEKLMNLARTYKPLSDEEYINQDLPKELPSVMYTMNEAIKALVRHWPALRRYFVESELVRYKRIVRKAGLAWGWTEMVVEASEISEEEWMTKQGIASSLFGMIGGLQHLPRKPIFNTVINRLWDLHLAIHYRNKRIQRIMQLEARRGRTLPKATLLPTRIPQRPEPAGPTNKRILNPLEYLILNTLGAARMTGEAIAEKAKRRCDGHFKGTLSALVKSGVLVNRSDAIGRGYEVARPDSNQDQSQD